MRMFVQPYGIRVIALRPSWIDDQPVIPRRRRAHLEVGVRRLAVRLVGVHARPLFPDLERVHERIRGIGGGPGGADASAAASTDAAVTPR
jgi:hypothetical protein